VDERAFTKQVEILNKKLSTFQEPDDSCFVEHKTGSDD
jgi:hypothetical protein